LPWLFSFSADDSAPLEVRSVLLYRVYGTSWERAARVYVIG